MGGKDAGELEAAEFGRRVAPCTANCHHRHNRPPSCIHWTAGNDAGETFTKLADVHLKLESKHDAAGAWVEAAKAYLKSDQRRA